MNKRIIPIIYATNNGYAPYAGVSIQSLIANASPDFFYEITVFHTDLSNENIARFKSMNGENFSVKPLCVTRFIEKELKLMYTNFHFSKEMFYRILIPTVFENYDRAVYLDCDTVVLGDVSELYETDLEGNVIAAANDIMHTKAKDYVINNLKLDVKKYINSGVLVIDCKKFRELDIKGKFFGELAKRPSLKYPDQDLINLVCKGNIKYLPRKWNYIWHYHTIKTDPTLNLPPEEMKQYLEDANDISLLHFTSAVKPWKNKTIELSNFFWKYVPGCVFENQVINVYKNVPMKHYIGYHFIDVTDSSVVITASLYALDEIKYSDVITTVDGFDKTTTPLYSHVIEIAGRVYNRTFFTIEIPLEKITHRMNISFYEKESGDVIQTIFSATFPLDASLRSYHVEKEYIFYNFKGNVFFGPLNEKVLQEKSGLLRNDLEKRLKNKSFKKTNILRRLHKLLSPFFKKEIWFVSDRIDSAGDNGQAFFEYLCKNTPKNVKPYFILDKNSKDYKKIKKIGKVLQPGSWKIKLYYLFCTRNISAHFEKAILHPIFNYTQLKDILGKCKNVFLQHGIIKDDLSQVYNRPTFDMDIFVTSAKSEYESIAYNPAYLCGKNVTKITGLPRYDKLVDKKEKLVIFLPTWRKYCYANAANTTPVNNIKDTPYFKFYNELLHNERLISVAKETGYKFCYYPHDLMRRFNKNIEALDREVFVDPEKFTYTDVFAKASLLFTDFSSCQFDFAYLRKPVIYCHFDKKEFFDSHTYKEGYFSYEDNGFGEVTYDIDGAVECLVDYMTNNCVLKNNYLERINSFFAYNDTSNCERVMAEILKL